MSLPPAATPNPEASAPNPDAVTPGTAEPTASANTASRVAPLPDSPVAASQEALLTLWPRIKPWALGALVLLAGFGLGVVVTKHRHAAQINLAAVNGVLITRDDLNGRMQTAIGQQVMHLLVQDELQLQFAKKQGVPVTDDQVEQRFEQVSKDTRFYQALYASGMGVGDYKHMLRVKLAQANVLTQGITVSDAEIKQFYTKQSDPANPKAQFYKPETISLRAIQVTSPIVAQRVEQELSANTPFELAAAEYSQDESRSNGGSIAPLQFGRTPLHSYPDIEAKIFGLKIGEVSKPLAIKNTKTGNNDWWIFRCEDKTPGQAVPFETIKEECRLGAEIVKGSQLKGASIQTAFQQFQQQSVLQSFLPQYTAAVTGHQ